MCSLSTWHTYLQACAYISEPDINQAMDLIRPGDKQKDQVPQEIAREQESGPGLRTSELVVAIAQHDRAHLAHQEMGA